MVIGERDCGVGLGVGTTVRWSLPNIESGLRNRRLRRKK